MAGFGGRLQPGRSPVVLGIDMVRAYFEPGNAFCLPVSTILETARAVLDSARANGVPVIHTRVEYGPGAADGGLFVAKVPALRQFGPGAAAGAIVDAVAPLDDELVVVKQYASAFFGTSLSTTLRVLGCDTVVILGVSTSGCVRATAVDAVSSGFVPLVVEDGVADRATAPHQAALSDIQAKYGEVASSSAVLDYLGQVGG
ncbi:isochorismatase family protein [Actinomadura sp. 9N215]|uniref:isochorismatase family protein n=1 Tax=Actinomadura sp. 9N215 TaxID=3375150 RepID=UPI0037AF5982